MPMGLNKLDFAIIALYLIGITLFGLRFRKKTADASRLFSCRARYSVVGDCAFDRGGGN